MNLFDRVSRRLHRKDILAQQNTMTCAPSEVEFHRLLEKSTALIDLGSGATPVKGATVAVDMLIDPEQRAHGKGAPIDVDQLEQRGIHFVEQSIDKPLPFVDSEFDFAYSSHVIEHVAHPGRACNEMMRIAERGLMRCPAAMAEFLYGREYHCWLVIQRAGTLVFVEKTDDEFSPFGSASNRAPGVINPFEAMLDWERLGPSTPSSGLIGRLKNTLQKHFYGRSPLSEVNLFWEGGFRWVEVRRDGTIEQGGSPGHQYFFDASGIRHDFARSDT